MKIGVMNNPARSVYDEIKAFGKNRWTTSQKRVNTGMFAMGLSRGYGGGWRKLAILYSKGLWLRVRT